VNTDFKLQFSTQLIMLETVFNSTSNRQLDRNWSVCCCCIRAV